MKKALCIILIFFSGKIALMAAEPDKFSLKEDTWQELTEDVHYDEEEPQKKKERNFDTDFKAPDWSAFKPLFFGIIIIAGVVVIVIIIVRITHKSAPAGTGKRIEAKSIDEAEENLPEVALDNIYKEAVDKSDFKLALRIKFLMVLQKMIDKGLILWKKRKTNEQYLYELRDLKLKGNFASIVSVYDDAWYGASTLTEKDYNGIIERIDQLNQTLHEE